ncbi:MAG: formylglycine-generating enzyme family protein, partial [Planctomycetota bacterium]
GEVDAALAELAALVGERDADYRRWRGIVQEARRLRDALEPLDRSVSLPEAASADLSALRALVGGTPADVQRWQRKMEQVESLTTALQKCMQALVLPPEAPQQLGALAGLVSQTDPDWQRYAVRIRLLQGPPRPDWASGWGRDDFGRWAEVAVGESVLRLRYIPPGRVRLGSPDNEVGRDADERPVTMQVASAFWLAETECTQAQWRAITGAAPAWGRGDADLPVERIDWRRARSAAERLSALVPGLSARLPSELEWEYACRAGQEGPHPRLGGDGGALQAQRLAEIGRHAADGPEVVGQLVPNRLGLHDMLGNVWEWCRDGYAPYPADPSPDHVGGGSGVRVARGGCWADPPEQLRAANRVGLDPAMATMYCGIRFAADVDWQSDAGLDATDAPAPAQ